MRSVYVQSKSLVGRGLYEGESMKYGVVGHNVSGRFGRHGQAEMGGLGTRSRPCAPGTHNMHAFTSIVALSHFP